MQLVDTRTSVRAALEVRGLGVSFAGRPVVDDVSFSLARSGIVALVGESGSGKSTIARVIARLLPPGAGDVRILGRSARDYGRHYPVQMVFQDPFGSLNPAHTVAHHVERPLRIRGRTGEPAEILASVGLDPSFLGRRPHELSGGQRQRVAIARALAAGPDVLVADEPTSMLDVSLRAGVLELFARLSEERGLACLFITHDLASARTLADRILVLYAGTIVEEGRMDDVLAAPAHPYTRLLLDAARPGNLRGPLPARAGPPAPDGCAFAARCPLRVERCTSERPGLRSDGGRGVACFRAGA